MAAQHIALVKRLMARQNRAKSDMAWRAAARKHLSSSKIKARLGKTWKENRATQGTKRNRQQRRISSWRNIAANNQQTSPLALYRHNGASTRNAMYRGAAQAVEKRAKCIY